MLTATCPGAIPFFVLRRHAVGTLPVRSPTRLVPRLILVPVQRKLYQLVDHLWKLFAGAGPHLGKSRRIGQARHRVDLVHQQLAGVIPQERSRPAPIPNHRSP